ncbi:MAG: site-2 protease family protein [Candidatus Woesearchaeota archaeon]
MLDAILGYEHIGTILFYSVVILLLYLNRKKFEFQGIIALYKTKLGLKQMDNWARKYGSIIKKVSAVGVWVGYIVLVLSVALIAHAAFRMLIKPIALDGSPLVLPGVPIAGTGGVVFPLVIGWIALFIIIVVHEFSHGIVARAYNIKVKSSGIIFLGPILGAFVEPDEKKLNKNNPKAANRIFAAGPWSNFILTIIILLASLFILSPLAKAITEPAGVQVETEEGFPAESIPEGTTITQVNGNSTLDINSFIENLDGLKPNQTVILANDENTYEIKATESPHNKSQGYLGVYLQDKRTSQYGTAGMIGYSILHWLNELFFWVWFISLNIGIINLFPIFITDGARMLHITLHRYIKNQKQAEKIWVNINKICLILLLMIVFIPVGKSIFLMFT